MEFLGGRDGLEALGIVFVVEEGILVFQLHVFVKRREEIALKECVGIKIPNADPADKTPWESIVVGANRVHEDKFGKGMWMKLPVDGQTRVSRSVITGQDENGKNIYENTSRMVSNRDLKSMMESYKSREKNSIRDALAQPAVHGTGEKPRTSDMQR